MYQAYKKIKSPEKRLKTQKKDFNCSANYIYRLYDIIVAGFYKMYMHAFIYSLCHIPSKQNVSRLSTDWQQI